MTQKELNLQLIVAISNHDVIQMKKILKAGADPNTRNSEGWPMLMCAAWTMNAEVTKVLLEYGADPNVLLDYSCDTVISFSAHKGDLETTAVLLEAGADPNISGTGNYNALMYAITCEHPEVAKLLLENGANVNAVDDIGNTSLEWAVGSGNTDTVKMLLEYGADPNTQNQYGNTVLMRACRGGQAEMVKMLLDHGADPHIRNKDGDTTYQYLIKTLDKPMVLNDDDMIKKLKYIVEVFKHDLAGQEEHMENMGTEDMEL